MNNDALKKNLLGMLVCFSALVALAIILYCLKAIPYEIASLIVTGSAAFGTVSLGIASIAMSYSNNEFTKAENSKNRKQDLTMKTMPIFYFDKYLMIQKWKQGESWADPKKCLLLFSDPLKAIQQETPENRRIGECVHFYGGFKTKETSYISNISLRRAYFYFFSKNGLSNRTENVFENPNPGEGNVEIMKETDSAFAISICLVFNAEEAKKREKDKKDFLKKIKATNRETQIKLDFTAANVFGIRCKQTVDIVCKFDYQTDDLISFGGFRDVSTEVAEQDPCSP